MNTKSEMDATANKSEYASCRKTIRLSEIGGLAEAEILIADSSVDTANNAYYKVSNGAQELESMFWINQVSCVEEKIFNEVKNSCKTDDSIEVDQVRLYINTEKEETIIVGYKGGNVYRKWSNSGKFPYYKCSFIKSDNDGVVVHDDSYNIVVEGETTLWIVYWDKDKNQICGCRNGDSTLAAGVKKVKAIDGDNQKIYKDIDWGNYSNTDIIVDVNLLIDGYVSFGSNNRFILDGGNLYRWYSLSAWPDHLVCKNGSAISFNLDSIKNEERAGAMHGIYRGVDMYSRMVPNQNQGCYSYEINALDFIDLSKDVEAVNSSASINLTNVLNRIFGAVYDRTSPASNRFLIKFPENQFGNCPYFLKETLRVPNGVKIDFGGAKLSINSAIFEAKDKNSSVITFEHYPNIPNRVSGQICNVELSLDRGYKIENKKLVPADFKLDKVFDLTNFSGILEDVTISLGDLTNVVALWQPIGTPVSSYSDQKIIRRCRIARYGWRTDVPTAVFGYGDGCIIEQCNLGFVAIIGGNSYTIRGCLNDKYFLCDTSVDFTGSYWEIGQFEVLSSEVRFNTCRIYAVNDLAGRQMSDMERKYLGPWFSVDTKASCDRLRRMINDWHLNVDNFTVAMPPSDEVGATAEPQRLHVFLRPSKVEFGELMKVQHQYWGYLSPLSSPLVAVEGTPTLIGFENLVSVPEVYLSNRDKYYFNDKRDGYVIDGYELLPSTLPLVSGDFYNWRHDIAIPEGVSVMAANYNKGTDQYPRISNDPDISDKLSPIGLKWNEVNNPQIDNVRVIFELDKDRLLYSPVFCFPNCKLNLVDGHMPYVFVNLPCETDKAVTGLKNIKTVLVFDYSYYDKENRKVVNTYMAREHFKEAVRPILSNMDSTDQVSYRHQTSISVGTFALHKRPPQITSDVIATNNMEYNNEEKIQNTFYSEDSQDNTCTDVSNPLCPGWATSGSVLTDGYGNRLPMALGCYPSYHFTDYTECRRLEYINDRNVRAYIDADGVPEMGQWTEGDEMVLTRTGDVFRYFGGIWQQYIRLL